MLQQHSAVKRRDPMYNKSEYSRLNKMVKKSCKTDDNNWTLRVVTDLEAAAMQGGGSTNANVMFDSRSSISPISLSENQFQSVLKQAS